MEEKILALAFNIKGRVYLIYRLDGSPVVFNDKKESLVLFKNYISAITCGDSEIADLALRGISKLSPHVLELPDTSDELKTYCISDQTALFRSGDGIINHIGVEVKPNALEMSVMNIYLYIMEKVRASNKGRIPDEENVRQGEEILNTIKF